MSLRYLKFETEAENGMVDERGVLIPGATPMVPTGGSTGSSGGYTYFGLTTIQDGKLYKMSEFGVIDNPSRLSGNNTDVTKAEFEKAYTSGLIMLVPVDKNTGVAKVKTEGYTLDNGKSYPQIIVGYYSLSNSGYKKVHCLGYGNIDTSPLEFAKE